MPRRGEGGSRRHGNTQRRKRDDKASGFRERFGVFFPKEENEWTVAGSVSGLSRPPHTRVRMSMNHLLIITALPAHNEKVKLADIAPEVVYETTIRESEMIPFQTLVRGEVNWSEVGGPTIKACSSKCVCALGLGEVCYLVLSENRSGQILPPLSPGVAQKWRHEVVSHALVLKIDGQGPWSTVAFIPFFL